MCRLVVLLLGVILLRAHALAQETESVAPAERTSMARLVDLAASQLNLEVEYDERILEQHSVLLRTSNPLDADELWRVTNTLLAARGLTTVRAPDSRLVSVVKLGDAASIQQLAAAQSGSSQSGYATVVYECRNLTPASIASALKPMLSRHGAAQPLGSSGLLLVSDLAPRVEQALDLIATVDVPGPEIVVRRVPCRFTPATQLAAMATNAATTRAQLMGRTIGGEVSPTPDDQSVVVVTTTDELVTWLELLKVLDDGESVVQQSYTPQAFAAADVAAVLEQVLEADGSGDHRIVVNDLTGSLIVSASARDHSMIEDLLRDLESAPLEARRPVRSYTIKNRPVEELVQVLQELVDAGALDASVATSGPPDTDPEGFQSDRLASSSDTAPQLSITADEATNTLIAVGDSRLLLQLESLLERLDVRQSQVMLEVMVVSLTEGDTLDLGVELQGFKLSGSTLARVASVFGLGTAGAILPAGGDTVEIPVPGRGFTGAVLRPGDFEILVRALETLNEGRSLNMPWVLVNNNQQGVLDAVVEAPYLSTNASDTVATTSFGGSSQAGTQVTVTPQIAEGDHLVLEYTVSLSTFVGESVDPSLPPPRQQNSVQSVVTIPDGYTVVVGGLEIVTEAEAIEQVPLLGDLPIIGEAFKSRSTSQSRSRFYAFIRANVMRQERFEDLKYYSDEHAISAGLDDQKRDWPKVNARIIP